MDEQNLTGGSGEVKNMQGDQKNKFSSLKKIVSEQKTFVWLGAVVVILAVVAGIGAYKGYAQTDYDKSQRDAGADPDRSPGADLTEEQMSDQVLWRLTNNLLVNDAAKKYAVMVEDKDIQNLKAQMLQKFKDEAAASEELTKRYGWDMKVYEQKVMHPFILQTKLAQKMKDDPKTKEDLKVQAEKVLEEVKN